MGNLPPNANVTDLKDHFSEDATKEIESLFLISKSNCAFVNYITGAACVAAVNRFHDSRFHGVRLICRLRRGSTSTPTVIPSLSLENSETTPSHHSSDSSTLLSQNSSASSAMPSHHSSMSSVSSGVAEKLLGPTIVGSGDVHTPPIIDRETIDEEKAPSDDSISRIPEKFFIVKSLTVQDLEASVRNGIWATQSHNEKALNEAYENADNVYLIFSANKSGEYFGYARMASTISSEPVNLSSTFTQTEVLSSGAPQSITTPATATAPKGKIIDDSARGTLFWEAEHSGNEDESSPVKVEGEFVGNQNWGKQFNIEWISTERQPFYRTRGLRNPWK